MQLLECTVEWCSDKPIAKNLCSYHYNQKSKGKPFTKRKVRLLCSVDGCTNISSAKTYCVRHYNKYYNSGDPNVYIKKHERAKTNGDTKYCAFCNKYKPLKDFETSATTSRRKYCNSCKPYQAAAWAHNLTPEQFWGLYGDGTCNICGKVNVVLHIDHDHSCCGPELNQRGSCGNCARGVLCRQCNYGLGNFRDDEKLMFKAIDYLRRTNGK